MKYRLWDKQTKKMIYDGRTADGTSLFLCADGNVVGYGDGDDGYGGLEAHKCYFAGRFLVLRCVDVFDRNNKLIYEGDIVRVLYEDDITGESRVAVGVVDDGDSLGPMVDFGPKAVPLGGFVFASAEFEVLGNTEENPDWEFDT